MQLPMRRGAAGFHRREGGDIGGVAAGRVRADGEMPVRAVQGVPDGIQEPGVGELHHEPVILAGAQLEGAFSTPRRI